MALFVFVWEVHTGSGHAKTHPTHSATLAYIIAIGLEFASWVHIGYTDYSIRFGFGGEFDCAHSCVTIAV